MAYQYLITKEQFLVSNWRQKKNYNEIHVHEMETFHLHITSQEKNLGMSVTVGWNVISSSAIVIFSTVF